MTIKAPINGRLVAGGVAAAVAVWAGAFLLPAPRTPAVTVSGPGIALAAPPVDPAVFGALQMSMAPPPPAPRVSILDAAGRVPLTSISLASTPLQSIGATFAEPVAGTGLPELGGASALDGPADAGLDSPVARSGEADTANLYPPPPRGKIIAIDASEGTKIDPLRQRNWDLNAVQVIPPMPSSAPPKR
ncbi:MAG: hypothetical protein Q8M31_06070 [Beijerinckiaceae bacterium]|nr:hypothetical protein [Beijerinckiaceae bacterium]